MKVVKNAQFVPGVCLVCGGSDSDREWFLDIEKQAEFWGNIYFCNLCCGTIAVLFRCGDVGLYQDRVLELEAAGVELLERVEVYESALASLSSLPRGDSLELSFVLAHKELARPEPEVGVSKEPAGVGFAESVDGGEVGELSGLSFVHIEPDTNTGW